MRYYIYNLYISKYKNIFKTINITIYFNLNILKIFNIINHIS